MICGVVLNAMNLPKSMVLIEQTSLLFSGALFDCETEPIWICNELRSMP